MSLTPEISDLAARLFLNPHSPGPDVASGNEISNLRGHPDCVWSVSFSPDGTRLASAGGDWGGRTKKPGEVKIWDMSSGQEVCTLRGHQAGVFGVAFSPCGRRLATKSQDGTVMLWDGTPLAETPAREPGEAP